MYRYKCKTSRKFQTCTLITSLIMAKHRPKHVADNTANRRRKVEYNARCTEMVFCSYCKLVREKCE
jgi:hypothetical protein